MFYHVSYNVQLALFHLRNVYPYIHIDIARTRDSAASTLLWTPIVGNGEAEALLGSGRNVYGQIWFRDCSHNDRPHWLWSDTAWSRFCCISS